jgi:hypothetical protein
LCKQSVSFYAFFDKNVGKFKLTIQFLKDKKMKMFVKVLCFLVIVVATNLSSPTLAGSCEDACSSARTSAIQSCLDTRANAVVACQNAYDTSIQNSLLVYGTKVQGCNDAYDAIIGPVNQKYLNCLDNATTAEALQACTDAYEAAVATESAIRANCIQEGQTQKDQRDTLAQQTLIACSAATYEAYSACVDSAESAYVSCIANCGG